MFCYILVSLCIELKIIVQVDILPKRLGQGVLSKIVCYLSKSVYNYLGWPNLIFFCFKISESFWG